LYIASHLITRITATAAIFSKPAEKELMQDQERNIIVHIATSIAGIALFTIQIIVIYWYKHRAIKEFRDATVSERIIHVLANTLVVIPFRPGLKLNDVEKSEKLDIFKNQTQNVEVNSENKDECKSNCSEINHNVTLKRKLMEDELEIEEFWWEDPTRIITVNDIKHIITKDKEYVYEIDNNDKESEAETKYQYLSENGYINKKLSNPRQTKQEYFWLFLLHIFINLVSLLFEFMKGGIETTKGMYLSWEIRILSFVVGLIFLRLYYDRINIIKSRRQKPSVMKRFKTIGSILCFNEKRYVTRAIPNDLLVTEVPGEDEVDRSKLVVTAKPTYETQTSIHFHIKKESLGGSIPFIDQETGEYKIIVDSTELSLSPTHLK
jgi:hypothetical protein